MSNNIFCFQIFKVIYNFIIFIGFSSRTCKGLGLRLVLHHKFHSHARRQSEHISCTFVQVHATLAHCCKSTHSQPLFSQSLSFCLFLRSFCFLSSFSISLIHNIVLCLFFFILCCKTIHNYTKEKVENDEVTNKDPCDIVGSCYEFVVFRPHGFIHVEVPILHSQELECCNVRNLERIVVCS